MRVFIKAVILSIAVLFLNAPPGNCVKEEVTYRAKDRRQNTLIFHKDNTIEGSYIGNDGKLYTWKASPHESRTPGLYRYVHTCGKKCPPHISSTGVFKLYGVTDGIELRFLTVARAREMRPLHFTK